MGRVYSVPRNVKGESRLLLIFTVRSFITTILGGVVGVLFYFIFAGLGLVTVGLISVGVCAGIGYGLGTLVIPDSPIVGNLRKAGGERVSDIVIRTITFKNRRKIYMYREGGNK